MFIGRENKCLKGWKCQGYCLVKRDLKTIEFSCGMRYKNSIEQLDYKHTISMFISSEINKRFVSINSIIIWKQFSLLSYDSPDENPKKKLKAKR